MRRFDEPPGAIYSSRWSFSPGLIVRRRDFAKAEDERASLRAEFTPGELAVLQLLAVGLNTIQMSHRPAHHRVACSPRD